MLKIFYYETLGGWQAPEITPFENLVLHPAAKVLHYAIEVLVIILTIYTIRYIIRLITHLFIYLFFSCLKV